MMVRFPMLILCSLVYFSVSAQPPSDTIQYYFEVNESVIDEHRFFSILESGGWAREKLITENIEVRIYAYSDCSGTATGNRVLAQKRADSVRRIFQNENYPTIKIAEIITRPQWNCDGKDAGYNEQNRRVDICLVQQAEKIVRGTKESEESVADTLPDHMLSELAELEVGKKVVLKDLLFVGGRHDLLTESMPVLDELVKIMLENPDLEIELQGHICCTLQPEGMDPETGELALSVNRARVVYNYLAKHGVEKERMTYKGFGNTQPLPGSLESLFTEMKNRRVEVMVTAK